MNAHPRLPSILLVTTLGALGLGGCTGTDDTTAASTTATTGDDESTSDGTTTGEMMPALEITRITDPSWEIVDFHQRSDDFGEGYALWSVRTGETLPPPSHIEHPDLGIGPGEAHAGPFDHEFADATAQHGWVDAAIFTRAEASAPSAIFSMFMVVPSAGAPTGKTPDAEDGPMIPHTIFPIHTAFQYRIDGTPTLGGAWDFDVPRLDAINPPYAVDGHSHFPIYDARSIDLEPAVGDLYETHVVMTDATGAGWDFTFGFRVE